MKTTLNATLAAAALFGLTAAAAPALAETPREATVIVSGEGEATLTPDMAILTMAVVREAETAADALSANNEAMAAVLADLKQAGVEERDVQTSGFSVSPRYRQDPSTDGGYEAPEIAGYQVSNSVTVRVRDLTALGGIIDRSVKLGVNDGGNIALTNDNPDAAVAQARKEAVADAAAKAKALTDAAGVKLGRIIEINENFARPMPQPIYRAAMAKEMSDASVPIASGENSYTVTVNITYAIEQ
ncbi:SIMPL domain-containing protein [Ciceribacter sp. L1K23]|uniref:SIMPL domain-containing protein n=1 Tax=Ciceribacter sp. L1K23 TaxID=2820276 RepID=UPI001B81284C|nr:SIMPL domain-containing protein [Ciceribacter sp. L1K23]MBR0554993.1 SIMPL domain-containing protein [Ciceribacter sp. L1K23]